MEGACEASLGRFLVPKQVCQVLFTKTVFEIRKHSWCFFISLFLNFLEFVTVLPVLLELFNLLSMYNMSLLCGRRGLLGEVSFEGFVSLYCILS